ncbi:MAG: hypothetical protein Q8L14_09150 [Myxococcales bacterium]|nr:hypothetical protein [Myxococcales bacterium]
MEFKEEKNLRAHLAKTLGPELDGLPQARTDISMGLAKLFETEIYSSHPAVGFALLVPEYKWVIRDDDLKLLDFLLTALKAAAAVGFFSMGIAGAPLVGAAAGIGAVVAALFSQAAKKGATVDTFELRLLIMLKANPEGLSTEDITKILRRCGEDVAESAVTATLTGLAKRAVSDGSTTNFVSQDSKLLWRAAGI